MAKLIIIAIAIWLVISILKRYRRGVDQSINASRKNSVNGEVMVQCKHCGIHLPQSDSIQSNGQFYCSQAHIDAPSDDA